MVNLTFKIRRRILILTNVVLGISLAATLAAAILLPLDLGQEIAPRAEQPRNTPAITAQARQAADYSVIYQRDLRKPLFDPKPITVIKPIAPPPKLTITLIGTAVAPEMTYGLFRNKDGQTKLVEIGQTIDGAEVIAVIEQGATVRFAGQTLTLTIEKKEGSP